MLADQVEGPGKNHQTPLHMCAAHLLCLSVSGWQDSPHSGHPWDWLKVGEDVNALEEVSSLCAVCILTRVPARLRVLSAL